MSQPDVGTTQNQLTDPASISVAPSPPPAPPAESKPAAAKAPVPQVRAVPVPQTSQQSLADAYENGDTALSPDLDAEYDAPAEAPSSVPARVPAVSTTPPATPAPAPKHNPRVVQLALDLGMTEPEIAGMTPDALEATAYHLNRQALAERRTQSRQELVAASRTPAAPQLEAASSSPPAASLAHPPAAVAAADEYALDPQIDERFDELLARTLKSLKKDVVDVKKENKQLRDELGRYAAREQAREAETISNQLDRLFAADAARFGDKPLRTMDANSTEYSRRMAVAGLMDRLAGTIEERHKKAVEIIYGTAAPAEEPPAAGRTSPAAVAAWNAAALQRPTNRVHDAEPPGVKKAMKTAAAKLKEYGVEDDETPVNGESVY